MALGLTGTCWWSFGFHKHIKPFNIFFLYRIQCLKNIPNPDLWKVDWEKRVNYIRKYAIFTFG